MNAYLGLVNIRPYYVDILKNKNETAMLSKLRFSAHKLAIEGGRYLNISKHERICTACNSGEVEDEEHFLDYNLNPLPKISVCFLLTAGRNSKGHSVCSGVC